MRRTDGNAACDRRLKQLTNLTEAAGMRFHVMGCCVAGYCLSVRFGVSAELSGMKKSDELLLSELLLVIQR